MFTPLHSSMNQEQCEKYLSNQSSHYKNTDIAARSENRGMQHYLYIRIKLIVFM